MNNKNIQFIKRHTLIGITIMILCVISFVIFMVPEYKTIGTVLLGSSLMMLFLFLLRFIPKARRIEITKYGLVFYSYKRCQTYFWREMKDVFLRDATDDAESENQIIVQFFKSGSNRTNPDDYFEVPINAGVFGYDTDELFKIIKHNLS